VFNYFINYKLGTRGIKPPISKPDIFSKGYNFIKSRSRYRIVSLLIIFLLGLYILEVAIKLLEPILAYIFFNNILIASCIQRALVILNS
jgi:hypothetical protein